MTFETFRDGSWIRTGEERLMSHANRLARVHQNLQLEELNQEMTSRHIDRSGEARGGHYLFHKKVFDFCEKQKKFTSK